MIQKYIWFFIILIFSPYFVFGELTSVEVNNGTININVTSENTVSVPKQNLTELGNAIGKALPKESAWTEGDVLVASSTIFAFFTFGSFLVIKFESKRKKEEMKAMDLVLGSILSIQIIHLIVIIVIMLGFFNPLFYVGIMILTVIILLLILVAVRRIIDIENREPSRIDLKQQYHAQVNTAYDDLRREFNKFKLQEGE